MKVEYINEYGEKMIVKIKDNEFWFYHSDCNEDFEIIDSDFGYILNEGEASILMSFINAHQEKVEI